MDYNHDGMDTDQQSAGTQNVYINEKEKNITTKRKCNL